MFYTSFDKDFSNEFQGAICFCEREGKILALKRAPGCYEGGRWSAAPGGKLEKGETSLAAAVRETFEETGIRLDPARLQWKGYYDFQFPDMAYGLHIFWTKLDHDPKVALDFKEHTEFLWATPEQVYQMDLMRGGKECLKSVYSLSLLKSSAN